MANLPSRSNIQPPLGSRKRWLPCPIGLGHLAIWLSFVFGSACICSVGKCDDKPNVLFLICDDLNCDLSSYGHPTVQTPNLSQLAQRGVQFNRAYCQYPLCGPSRASFMTGLYPDQSLVKRNAIYIREHVPNVQTLSQAFRGAGYFAARVGKIYHYNVPKHIGTSGHDDPYSWNLTINPRGRDKQEEDKIFSLKPGAFGATLSWLAAEGADEEQTDGIAATEAIELLERFSNQEQPFFLAVGLYRPHTPFVAPKKYFDLYPLEEIDVPTIPDGYLDTLPLPARKSITRRKEERTISAMHAKQAIQAYYASISFADAQLGRILAALEELGLKENTIVLFTSDHGYHMGEHGHWQKTTLFENATRVPLTMAGPGVKSLPDSDALAEMVDFYPTLTELSGVEPPPTLSGVSQVGVLQGKEASVRESALSEYSGGYSLRTSRYRYTEWGEHAADGRELYDHDTDPKELHNLAEMEEHQALVQRLSLQLAERVKDAKRVPKGLKQNLEVIKRSVPQPYN